MVICYSATTSSGKCYPVTNSSGKYYTVTTSSDKCHPDTTYNGKNVTPLQLLVERVILLRLPSREILYSATTLMVKMLQQTSGRGPLDFPMHGHLST